MSSLFCRIEGWRCEVADPDTRGIGVQIHVARDPNVSSTLLAGVVALDDEMAPSTVTITDNQAGISAVEGCDLLEIGCATIWNAVMIDQAAAAGAKWQFLADWLKGHRNPADAVRLEKAVNRAVC
jgi:hypothetical protein